MALCLSIGEPSMPDTKIEEQEFSKEISRYTLLGEWDAFFISILRERLINDNLDPESNILPQFKAHLNRGIMMLNSRIKDLSDITELLPVSDQLNKESTLNKKMTNTKRTKKQK